ncbi:MAG: carboxypeptidase regulatory-like domain-containing protein, partial [Pyrinomonadaceae bacterium]
MSSFDHVRRAGVFMMLLLISPSVAGQSQVTPSSDEAAEVTKTGDISGRVVNENGQPLSNVSVFARGFGGAGQGRNGSTDRDGTFRLSGLDRVAYSLSAQAPGYTPLPRDPDSTQPTYYRVGDSVTMVMIKGGVITGSVTTSDGEPLVGLVVRAQMLRDGDGRPSRYGGIFRERTTDDRGVYRIYGLPSGTYLVMAGGGGRNYWGSDTNPYEDDAPTYSPSSARDTAAEINVRTGEETANVDIRYRGDPGYRVSGTVSGSQAAEPQGYNLILTSTLDGGSQWSSSSYQPAGNPGFVIYGVADGDYDVTATSFSSNGESSISEPKRIKVRGADVGGVELTTKPLGSVAGRLILEASKAIECKGKRRPMFTETLVSAWHNEKDKAKDQPQYVWSFGGPRLPDESGNFSLRNLAAGQYHFIVRFFAKYWYLRSISWQPPASAAGESPGANRSVDGARNWLTVKPGDRLSGLAITLAEGAASLR